MLTSSSTLGDGDGSLWLVTAEKAEGTLTRFDASHSVGRPAAQHLPHE